MLRAPFSKRFTHFEKGCNLSAPEGERDAGDSELPAADLAEITRLYALRGWIEQSYKQVKNALGWAHYQVRKDLSIRRHWQLVCCAFSFCWWACVETADVGSPPAVVLKDKGLASTDADETAGGEKEGRDEAASFVATGVAQDPFVAPAIRSAPEILAGVYRTAPARRAQSVA